MKISITLHDDCARSIIREIAKRYAVLCIKSRMPSSLVNAPWSARWERQGRKKSWEAIYREWMAEIDASRADYRKSLQSVIPELPDVPAIELLPCTDPRGNAYAGTYPQSRVTKAAEDYADTVCGALQHQA